MLINDNAPTNTKVAPCIGCGRSLPYKTNARVCCPECKATRRLASARASMTKVRRKRGIAQVKGAVGECRECGAPFVRNSAAAKYCVPCRPEVALHTARFHSAKRRATPQGKAKANQYGRMRRQTDPLWRLSAHMRVRLHRLLGGMKARRSWRAFVPYSAEQLKAHIERQFLPGMTWQNHGKWHVDHIVPLSAFKITGPNCPEFRAAWSLTNLRPLWARDNMRKSARRTHLL